MTKLFSNLSILILVSLMVACTQETIPAPEALLCESDYQNHPNHAAYEQALQQYVSNSSAPGSVIGVKKYQEQEWVGAYGASNLEHQTNMEVCTPFRTGSVTKIFTAVIIMQLYDEGKINLSSTVAAVLPSISNDIPNSASMTVQKLLNHTSGLRQPTDDDINYQLTVINNPDYIGSLDARKRLEQYIYDEPLKHNPGEDSYYSNAGYWLLQLMIEQITGKTLQQNVEERIVDPLGLTNTYLEKRTDTDVSRGYNFSGQLLKDVTIWDRADSDGDPSAGIISTAADLLLFGEAIFKGNLVSDTSLALMKTTTSFPSCNGDCGYGLGIESWDTGQNLGYGKNGSSIGVDANLIFFPEQNTTIVIFSNFGGGNDKSVIDVLLGVE